MSGQGALDDGGTVSRDVVCERVAALLRGAQARGLTDDVLSGICGVPARRIKSYRSEGVEPPLSAALSLAVALGPQALNSVLALIGYSCKPVDEAESAKPALIVANMMGDLHTLATAAADNRIDHTEANACDTAANNLISMAAHFRKQSAA